MPWRPSIAACARLARISCRHRRWSNGIEALISRMIALGPSANRPPHIALESDMRRLVLSSVLLLFAAAGCHKQEPKAPQPAPTTEAAPAEAPSKVDRTTAGKPMPTFAFTDIAGQEVKFEQFKGKPVLVN